MAETGDFRLEGGRMLCVPWQSLQPGAYGSFWAAFLPCTLAAYWLLLAVALAAIDLGQFFGMRHFFDVAVAGDALERGMWGRFQGRRVEARGHSGLAFPDTRAGIVAAGTVLGSEVAPPAGRGGRWSAGSQWRRAGSKVHDRQMWYFSTNSPIRCR